MVHASRCCLRILLLTAVSHSLLTAQSTKAEFFGVIRDPGSLPVNGATVELTNVGTDVKLSVRTNAEGHIQLFRPSSRNIPR